MFYRQESPAVQWDGAKRRRLDKPSASINEERAKIIDLMEYQDKKQRKKNRIECEDQLIQDVQKRKSSRNEEVLRKAIPDWRKSNSHG